MKRVFHENIRMEMAKGTCYNNNSYTGFFKCPSCGRRVAANLNFLGTRKIFCNGLKTEKKRA